MASDVTPPPLLARCYHSALNEIMSSSKVGVTVSGQFGAFSNKQNITDSHLFHAFSSELSHQTRAYFRVSKVRQNCGTLRNQS